MPVVYSKEQPLCWAILSLKMTPWLAAQDELSVERQFRNGTGTPPVFFFYRCTGTVQLAQINVHISCYYKRN
jgi:hypothetical protein